MYVCVVYVYICVCIPYVYVSHMCMYTYIYIYRWYSGKESTYQCKRRKRYRFNPWVRKILWNSKWQPAPVFSHEKFQGQRRLVGYSLWGFKKLNTTEKLSTRAHTYTHAYTFKKLRSWHLVPLLHGKEMEKKWKQ